MPITPRLLVTAAVAVTLALALPARADLTVLDSAYVSTQLGGDFSKQIELGVGSDTCLYYSDFTGFKRRCGGVETMCDPSLSFVVGIAASTGGSFGDAIYLADNAVGDVHRAVGCTPSTLFATLNAPGALAFPPVGSAYGDFLYACAAFSGPIYRITPTGDVSEWQAIPTTYFKFGPGGTWGNSMFATYYELSGASSIVRVSSTGAITTLAPFPAGGTAEGFDWGFGGDLFGADVALGKVMRIRPDGTTTVFAYLDGAADVAYKPSENALYVVSYFGGLYRITPRDGGTTGAPPTPMAGMELAVAPNPGRGPCTVRFALPAAGVVRASIVDPVGRRVRRLADAWRPAGASVLDWDGRDDAGLAVRPGAYFVRVAGTGLERSARLTIVR